MNEAFGIVETVGGILKMILVVGTGIALYHLYSLQSTASGDGRMSLTRSF